LDVIAAANMLMRIGENRFAVPLGGTMYLRRTDTKSHSSTGQVLSEGKTIELWRISSNSNEFFNDTELLERWLAFYYSHLLVDIYQLMLRVCTSN
jgi:hypothetical protein